MNKKNAGFSLVELIVVIAIMAVLVGVLAPAYLKYVEKSRKSTDISAVSEIMDAADSVSTDVESVKQGITFSIAKNQADDFASLTCSDTAGDSEWKNTSNAQTYTFKSKTFKGDAGTFTGTVQSNGAVTWSHGANNQLFTDMTDTSNGGSSVFGDKFSN